MENEVKKPNYFLIGIMMAGTLVTFLNSSSLNIALPLIMVDLNIEHYSTIQWLTTINMLISGVLIPTTAFFITKFKSHHIYMAAMSLFTVGSLFAFIAPNFALLLIARILQAAATAILMPLLMNVQLASFSKEERGKAMGMFGMIYMLAPALSPLIAGSIMNHFDWRGVFLLITILAAIPLVISFFKLENILPQRETSMEYVSLVFSSIGFTALLLGLGNVEVHGWISFQTGGLIAIGAASLAIFAIRQFKVETPLLDLNVYRYSMFALASAIAVVNALLIYAPMIIMPFYLQNIRGYTPLMSGLIPMPGTILLAFAMPVTGALYDKIGARSMAVIGFILVTFGNFALSRLTMDTTTIYVVLSLMTRSVGFALVIMPLQTNGLNQLPARLNAAGAAVNSTVQQVAGAIGIALFITLKTGSIAANLPDATTYTTEAFEVASRQVNLDAINFIFLVSVGISLVALSLSFFIKKVVVEHEPEAESPTKA